jgi:hypothetical protein
MPVVRDIRLLGFIISTIVLGLLTKGYKISVQKIAFMTLKGIKVEVPERGVLVQVEEVSLTILQGAKWFSVLVRRPRAELDLPIAIDRLQQVRVQARGGASDAPRRTPAPGAGPVEAPGAAASSGRAAPGWVNGVMKLVLPPLADMLLRGVAACLELVVVESAARVTVPMVGHVCVSLQRLAVAFNTTSITTSSRGKEGGARGSKSKAALALTVSTNRLLISQNPEILSAATEEIGGGGGLGGGGWEDGRAARNWRVLQFVVGLMRLRKREGKHTAAAGARVLPRAGSLSMVDGKRVVHPGELSGLLHRHFSSKAADNDGMTTGSDKLLDGVLVLVEPSLFSCVFTIKVAAPAAVDAKIYRVLVDVGQVETEIQESFFIKGLEAHALIMSALGPPSDAGASSAQTRAMVQAVLDEGVAQAMSDAPSSHPSGQVQKAFATVPTQCFIVLRGVSGLLHMIKEAESVPAYVNPMLDPRHCAGLEFKLTPVQIKMQKAARADSGTDEGRRGEQAEDVYGVESQVYEADNADSLTISCGGLSPDGQGDVDESGRRASHHGLSLCVAETQEVQQVVHSAGVEGFWLQITLVLPASLLGKTQGPNDRAAVDDTVCRCKVGIFCS